MQGKFYISLAAARVNANLTQEEVAKKLKVGKQTIHNWESGKADIKASKLKDLCDLYNCPIELVELKKVVVSTNPQ